MNKDKPKTIVSDDALKFEKDHWSSNGSFRKRPDPGWTHNSQDLTGGFGVAYSVMFCGLIEIKKSLSPLNENKRTSIIRESILRVLHYSGIRSQGKKPKKLPKQVAEFMQEGADTSLSMQHVNLIINSEKFISSYENGKKMYCHPLNDVSFVATGVGNTADYIGYVSRDNSVIRACYVFDCLGNSQHIANTMTQAFEIKLKEMLSRNTQRDLLSSQGMQNGGWADQHLYEEGAGCWNNVSLPPVPPAVFDDNIYEGLKNAPDLDPLYDNKRGGAAREDQDLYDNRPEAKPLDYSDQGIYDNSTDNLGRKDCESEYDNCPKMESEDYLEGLLKQNIYDNNVRDKVADRMEENLYDNKQDTDITAMLDNRFGSHNYGNIEHHKDNIYDSGDPLYDNKSGEGSDRNTSECIYDNKTSSQTESKPAQENNIGVVETGPGFGESPYDNSPNNPVPIHEDDTYTSMDILNTTETKGLYDNIGCEGETRIKEESLYDIAEVVEQSTNSDDYINHRVNSIVIGNEYDKLADIYDTPFEKLEQDKEETLQIYDNALPNQQTDKPTTTNLVPELIYDNNQLVNPDKIEVLGEDDDFETNPVYGVPEEALSPSSIHANYTAEKMFNEQLAEPKKLSTTSTDFVEGAVYGESLISNVKSVTTSATRILPINCLPFFHRILSRKDCELLLRQNGDFLIRESQSKKGQYVISGLHLGQYQHLLFLAQDGKIQTKEREFPSVSHLVAHYMKTKELLSTGKNNLSLITPIIASFPDSDIYTMMS